MKKSGYIAVLICILLVVVALLTRRSQPAFDDTFNEMYRSYIRLTEEKKFKLSELLSYYKDGELRKRPEQFTPYYEMIRKVHQWSENADKYIDSAIVDIIHAPGTQDTTQILSDTHIPEKLLINTGKVKQLRKMMHETLDSMLNTLRNDTREVYRIRFMKEKYKDNFGKKDDWENKKFGTGIPVSLALANLAKLRYELACIEDEITSELYDEGRSHCGIQFEHNSPIVVSRTGDWLMPGDTYEASILMYTQVHYETGRGLRNVIVDGKPIPVINTVGVYRVVAYTPGVHTFSGTLDFMTPDSILQQHSFKHEYTVVKPIASVTSGEMNLFYAGVEYPVDIAVSLPLKHITARISRGHITGNNGKYVVFVPDTGVVTITVEQKPPHSPELVIDSFRYRAIAKPE